MPYVALYRRWRPGRFSDLVGQDQVRVTLSHAIETGHIGHAYMFVGPRGTGKTSTAKILAKALNCEHGPTPEPCGECEACRKIDDGSSMDVLEIDAASNRGIDEIRNLRETVKYTPVGRYKVYIIDEVHMLSTEAFNALLKTLEEPPEFVVFILATTEAHKVPATIQSRCQRYDFRRITVEEIFGRLRYICDEMGIKADDEALRLIALQADGGLRDALSILDQCEALAEDGAGVTVAHVRSILGLIGHDWIYDLTRAIAAHDTGQVLRTVAELVRDGKDLRQMLSELVLHFRSLLIYQSTGALEGLDLYAENDDVLREQSQLISGEKLMRMIERLHEAMNELRWSPQPRVATEMALLALTQDRLATLAVPAREVAARERQTAEPAEVAADESRLSRLEAQVAQLLKKGAASPVAQPGPAAAAAPATEQGTADDQTPPRRTAVYRAPAPGPEPETRSLSHSDAQPADVESEKQPASGAAAAGTPAAASMPPAAGAVTPAAQELWQQLLQHFRDQAPVVAMMAQAELAGATEDSLIVNFGDANVARMADFIHGKKLAAALTELAGRPMRVVCRGPEHPNIKKAESRRKRRPVRIKREPPAVDIDKVALDDDERAALERSQRIFGGRVVAVEQVEAPEMEPADSTEVPPPGDDDAPPDWRAIPPPSDDDAPPPDDDMPPEEI